MDSDGEVTEKTKKAEEDDELGGEEGEGWGEEDELEDLVEEDEPITKYGHISAVGSQLITILGNQVVPPLLPVCLTQVLLERTCGRDHPTLRHSVLLLASSTRP